MGETCIRVEAFDMRMRVAGMAEVALHPQHHDAEVVIDQIVVAIEKLQGQFSGRGPAPHRRRSGGARHRG